MKLHFAGHKEHFTEVDLAAAAAALAASGVGFVEPEYVLRMRRWMSTNGPRLNALEGLLVTAQKEAAAGREAVASLASEREANAFLTGEVEQLQKTISGLRAALWHVQYTAKTLADAQVIALESKRPNVRANQRA